MKKMPLGLTVAVLLLVLGGIALLLSRRPGSVAHLVDGSELRLLGVSMGTKPFTTERPWHALARRVLPKHFHVWIPQPIQGSGQRSNALAIWVQLRNPVQHTNFSRVWERLDAVSGNGEIMHPYSSEHGKNYQRYTLVNFPRRHSSFLLRFYDTNRQVAATLRVPNPCQGPFPEWKADPVPVTKTNGELAVTFKGLHKVWEESPLGNTNTYVHVVGYDLKWKDQPTTEWQAAWSHLEDPTGNWIGGVCAGLPESEPVWRLTQWFTRTDDANFSAEERFVVPNIAVQDAACYTNLNIFTN